MFWVRFIIHYTILITSIISWEQILLRSWPIRKLFFATIWNPSHIFLLFNIKSKYSFHRAIILIFYLCWTFCRVFKVKLIKNLRISSWHWFLELVFKFILSVYFTHSVRFSISTFMLLIHELGILNDRNLSLILLLWLWCSRWQLMGLNSLFLNLRIFLLIIFLHLSILVFPQFSYFLIIISLLILGFVVINILL